MRLFLFPLLLAFVHLPAAAPHTIAASNPPRGPVLVELFTSEGCSSCPPADALLRKINGTRTADGRLVVGISEHVTYWNHLGWRDPYSLDNVTDRQQRYAQRFRIDGPYTPQMVVNGEFQFTGSDDDALKDALAKAQSDAELAIQSVRQQGSVIVASYTYTGEIPADGLDLNAAVTRDSAESHVARGENSGRMLQHVAVAESVGRPGTVKKAGEGQVSIALPKNSTGARHLVLFAQEAGQGRVQAVAVAEIR